jgi:hypothetical protein
MNLNLCSKCVRHVREGASSCPFCGATEMRSPPTALGRAGRTALLGAAMVTASCHTTIGSHSDGGAQTVPTTVPTTVYGGPPPFETAPFIPIPRDGGLD